MCVCVCVCTLKGVLLSIFGACVCELYIYICYPKPYGWNRQKPHFHFLASDSMDRAAGRRSQEGPHRFDVLGVEWFDFGFEVLGLRFASVLKELG